MDRMQDTTGLARFGADLMRSVCGLPLSDEPDMDAAPEGMGTLTAQAMAAEIAVGPSASAVRELRAVQEAIAETRRRLHRPGRVFA